MNQRSASARASASLARTAGVLFGIALWRRNGSFERVALAMLVAFAVLTVPVYLTGEAAEDTAEHAPGVSERAVEQHEAAAAVSLAAVGALGVVALAGLVAFRRAPAMPAAFATLLVVATLVTSAVFAWTGYLGGQIRHGIAASATADGHAALGRHDDD